MLTGFLHVYEEMEKAQAAMVRLMIKVREAAGPSGSQGSYCPRLVRKISCHFIVRRLCQKFDLLCHRKESLSRFVCFPCRTVLHGELWERNILIRVEQECCNNESDAV